MYIESTALQRIQSSANRRPEDLMLSGKSFIKTRFLLFSFRGGGGGGLYRRTYRAEP